MRKTSLQCYLDIESSGLLTEIRLKVLKGVSTLAPCTATELEKYMNLNYNMKGTWKVLSWLREAGVVYEKQERNCSVTNRIVIEWDLTGNMPVKPKKKNKVPSNLDKCINYILKGMEIRTWDSISKDTLIKLKSKSNASKKKKN